MKNQQIKKGELNQKPTTWHHCHTVQL